LGSCAGQRMATGKLERSVMERRSFRMDAWNAGRGDQTDSNAARERKAPDGRQAVKGVGSMPECWGSVRRSRRSRLRPVGLFAGDEDGDAVLVVELERDDVVEHDRAGID